MTKLNVLDKVAMASLTAVITLTPFQPKPSVANPVQEKSLHNTEHSVDLVTDKEDANNHDIGETLDNCSQDSPECSQDTIKMSDKMMKMSKEMSEEVTKMSKMSFQGISYGVSGALVVFYFAVIGFRLKRLGKGSQNGDNPKDL